MDNKDTAPRKGETAAQFKARIEETQRELAREDALKTPTPAALAPVPPPQTPEAPQVSPTPVAVKPPEIPNVPAVPVTGNPEVDAWIVKKGFKSMEDVANSLREAEREIMRRKEEQRPPAPAAPVPPVHVIPPPVNPWAFNPVPPPTQPVDVARLAKNYDLAPEDFEKVAAVAKDMAESVINQTLGRTMRPIVDRLQGVDREVGRQKELVSLMSDPLSRNPQVQYEMHRVLEEDPSIFDKQALPYLYARDLALVRIARANLGGSSALPTTPEQPSAGRTRPPATAGGNGSGGGGPSNTPSADKVTPEQFAALPLSEKRAHLKAVGAI